MGKRRNKTLRKGHGNSRERTTERDAKGVEELAGDQRGKALRHGEKSLNVPDEVVRAKPTQTVSICTVFREDFWMDSSGSGDS